MVIPTGLLGSEQALRDALAGGAAAAEPFTTGGAQAFDLQRLLSGAGGPAGQAEAFRGFQASPGQQFLQSEAEQALLRNQAAIGGLGGGRVRSALQDQAIGLAQQDFGNQFNRLGQVAATGGQFTGQQVGNITDIGQMLAGGRTRAGEQIASSIGGTTSALANLINQQGTGLSSILGAGGGNLANLLTGRGAAELGANVNLASLLSGVGGISPEAGKLDEISKIIAALGTL